MQDLITQNIDALIYIPAGATAATVPTKTAKAAGIPVINVDRNADGAPGDTFIATDSVASAKAVCDYIAKQAGGKGEMIIIHGQKGTTPEVDRSKGCGEALAGLSGHQGRRRTVERRLASGRRLQADAGPAAGASRRVDHLRPGRRAGARCGPGGQGRQSRPQGLGRRLRRRRGGPQGAEGRRVRRHRDAADAGHGPAGRRLRRSSWWPARTLPPSSCRMRR